MLKRYDYDGNYVDTIYTEKEFQNLKEALERIEDIIQYNADKNWFGVDNRMIDIIKEALGE
ncbi:MAG: hypothetical protein J7L43_02060 [Candidatus Aenigmarchaeota archaeon]|nr:hypothetical protein [Candidatus Aenigmarchaeota archaeon]